MSDLLIPAAQLRITVGRGAAEDHGYVADLLRHLKGRLESTLNLAIKNAEFGQELRSDAYDDVEAITAAMEELAGFFEFAASEVRENNHQPVFIDMRERGAVL